MYKQMSRQVVNPNQELAILHTAGPAQVIAGPGSGKTFVTIHRILHLITEQGVDPARILVITFTKAAALEMQERFFRLTQPKRLPVRFGTFHAVFYHILKQSARYQGYSIMTESEKRRQIRQIVRMYSRFASVQEEDLDAVKKLGVMLRIAESLDRSCVGCIRGINCDVLGDSVIMKTEVEGDASLEIRDAMSANAEFKKSFRKNLEIL